MPDYEKLRKNLEAHGFDVTYFDTAAEAVDYLDRKLDGKTVGHGGSITLRDMGLIERLQRHTTVRSHWLGDSFADAAASSVYLTSVYGLAETGELINIDGTGNRVAAITFGPENVILVAGVNKIENGVREAMSRARNTAAPLNVKRLGLPNPCSKAGKCMDCTAQTTICSHFVEHRFCKPAGRIKVILVGESLGY